MPRTHSGTETETSAQNRVFSSPYPIEVTIYNDGPGELIIGCPEVLGADEHTMKSGESIPLDNLKGDIQKVTTRVASGSAAYRIVGNVVKDIVGGGGTT